MLNILVTNQNCCTTPISTCKDSKNLRKNGRMRAKYDKWLVLIPFLCYPAIFLISAEIAVYGGYQRKNCYLSVAFLQKGKLVETASLISCTYPTTATKNACFTYHCTDKGNHFFSLDEKYGNEINSQVLVALFRYVLHAVH